MITEIQALQNAANDLDITIVEKYPEGKRKTVKKYFAAMHGTCISPVLDYENLNHFLLGYRRAKSILTTQGEKLTINQSF